MAKFMRYGILGLAINMCGYLLYLLITYLGVPPKMTMTFLYMTAVVIGFFGNKKLVFRHEGKTGKAAIRFLIGHVFGYMINFLLLLVLSDMMGYPHELVQAAAIFIVAGFLFIFMRLFVFRERA